MSERRTSLVGVVPAAGLAITVLGIGAIAMYAESQRDWGSYFLMEQTMSVGASLVVPLLALTLLSLVVIVAISHRFEV